VQKLQPLRRWERLDLVHGVVVDVVVNVDVVAADTVIVVVYVIVGVVVDVAINVVGLAFTTLDLNYYKRQVWHFHCF